MELQKDRFTKSLEDLVRLSWFIPSYLGATILCSLTDLVEEYYKVDRKESFSYVHELQKVTGPKKKEEVA